jgi:hypothetical protein
MMYVAVQTAVGHAAMAVRVTVSVLVAVVVVVATGQVRKVEVEVIAELACVRFVKQLQITTVDVPHFDSWGGVTEQMLLRLYTVTGERAD